MSIQITETALFLNNDPAFRCCFSAPDAAGTITIYPRIGQFSAAIRAAFAIDEFDSLHVFASPHFIRVGLNHPLYSDIQRTRLPMC